jgi:hypothetical protein
MKPVSIPSHAFTFCRYSIALLVWLAWGFRSVWCLAAAALVLVLSAVLAVRRAPMIVLYSQTVLRLFKSPEEIVDETAMRFAHILGSIFAGVCLVGIWLRPEVGWRVTFLFALLKTVSALGFCPATKLFGCASNSTCCPVTKKMLGVCQPKKSSPPQE